MHYYDMYSMTILAHYFSCSSCVSENSLLFLWECTTKISYYMTEITSIEKCVKEPTEEDLKAILTENCILMPVSPPTSQKSTP